MPIPFIIAGVAAVGAIFGAGKTAKAVYDNYQANDYNDSANRIIDRASRKANEARVKSSDALKALGELKVSVLSEYIKPFIKTFSLIKNVNFSDVPGLNELSKLKLDKQDLKELEELSGFASSIASGAISGGVAGAAAAFGAYSGVMALGTASTGAAIGSLSGAAATNATLAWLGGGSLATGGMGMAGGAAVLGGLVAAPALVILGCVLGSKASANLDNAKSNYHKAREYSEQMDVCADLCNGIEKRANLFSSFISALSESKNEDLHNLLDLIREQGRDYSSYTQESKKKLACAVAKVKLIKTVIDTPILTEEGTLTSESDKLSLEMPNQIQQIAN